MVTKRQAFMTPATEVYRDVGRAWNRDGYDTKLKTGMEVLEVALGNIVAAHPYRDEIVCIEERDGASTIELIHPFPPKIFTAGAPFRLTIASVHSFSSETMRVTDVRLSAETNYLYLLDVERTCIHRLDLQLFEGVQESLHNIPLLLPRGVTLDARSRLEVVPRDTLQPEKRDETFFVSSPTSSVILKVEAKTGNSIVCAGIPNRPGDTKESDGGGKVLLRSPSCLCYDDQATMLFWGDSENRAIFALKGDQVIEVVRFGSETHIESLLVYRLQDYVDSPLVLTKKDQIGSPFWSAEPALLVIADSLSRRVMKVRLHSAKRDPKSVISISEITRHGLAESSIRRVLSLRRGDLLVTTSSPWIYQIRQENQEESQYHQSGFVS